MSRQSGFRKLKPGCIHMRCPSCGRKQSNMKRSEHDHPTAFLVEMECDNCGAGNFESLDYFDKRGRALSGEYFMRPSFVASQDAKVGA